MFEPIKYIYFSRKIKHINKNIGYVNKIAHSSMICSHHDHVCNFI